MAISIQFVATALKAARKKKKLTQRELSKKIKIPQGHISNIENGAVDLHLSSLVEMARSLDLELMLVPRSLVPVVRALQKPDTGDEQIPLYRLEPEEEFDD